MARRARDRRVGDLERVHRYWAVQYFDCSEKVLEEGR